MLACKIHAKKDLRLEEEAMPDYLAEQPLLPVLR